MKFYITYSFMAPTGSAGVGRAIFDVTCEPQTADDVLKVEAEIGRLNPELKSIFLTWWKLLEA